MPKEDYARKPYTLQELKKVEFLTSKSWRMEPTWEGLTAKKDDIATELLRIDSENTPLIRMYLAALVTEASHQTSTESRGWPATIWDTHIPRVLKPHYWAMAHDKSMDRPAGLDMECSSVGKITDHLLGLPEDLAQAWLAGSKARIQCYIKNRLAEKNDWSLIDNPTEPVDRLLYGTTPEILLFAYDDYQTALEKINSIVAEFDNPDFTEEIGSVKPALQAIQDKQRELAELKLKTILTHKGKTK